MASNSEVDRFIKSQQSLQYYKRFQEALRQVLSRLPETDYKKITRNLIFMVIHEGALAQVMHFPAKSKFKIVQFTFPKKMPLSVLRYVIAHELGHVLQGRNWRKSDGSKLEENADEHAARWGFPKTRAAKEWISEYSKSF